MKLCCHELIQTLLFYVFISPLFVYSRILSCGVLSYIVTSVVLSMGILTCEILSWYSINTRICLYSASRCSVSVTCALFLLQLVSSFQIEAMSRQQEAQTTKNKLSSVRKMIAKLLKSINEVTSTAPLLKAVILYNSSTFF